MSYTKDIVILTKSAKNGGYCVAGIDIKTKKWVRLVKETEPIYDEDMVYHVNKKRCYFKPLDVVRVPFKFPCPNGCQTENEAIDISCPWEFQYTWTLEDVLKIHPAEKYPNIFGNYSCALDASEKNRMLYSLMLIRAYGLEFYTSTTGKTKLNFQYNGRKYLNMSVTDRDYFGCENHYNLAYLVVSIPNDISPKYSRYYKFIAKVFAKLN